MKKNYTLKNIFENLLQTDMKQRRIKFQILLALLVSTSFVAQAQNQLIVTLTNGQTDAFNVSDIRSIKFANNTMKLTENSGTQSSWPMADISQYAFSDATSIGQNTLAGSDQTRIFPNPVSDNLSIEYRTSVESKIAIELLDYTGKVLRTVYSGMHQGKVTYTWKSDLPAGIYLCRIASKQKSTSKTFVIQ